MIRRILSFAAASALTAAALVPFAMDVVPRWEARVAPVLELQRVDIVTRHDDRVCWWWSALKAREGRSLRWVFTLVGDDGERTPVSPWRADERRPLTSRRSTPAGEHFSVPLCADVPAWMRDDATLTIEGETLYDLPDRAWHLVQPIPSVVAPRATGR